MADLETAAGTVETVVFTNADNSFCVFRLRPVNGAVFTVTVNMMPPLVGEMVELDGFWVEHKRFGQQFQGEVMRRIAPTTNDGIERFLASGAVAGIGPALAQQLVAAFGADTLEVIAKEPAKLLSIHGIGKKKMQKIHEAYSEQSELRELMLFLEMHGVSGGYAARIYKQYLSFSIDVIKANPYRLAREVDGIGFRMADQIALAVGREQHSFERLRAGLDFALLQAAAAGHCCVPEALLAEQTAKLIKADRQEIAAALKKLLLDEVFYTEDVGNETLIYPRALYLAEKNVAQKLCFLKARARALNVEMACAHVQEWERKASVQLAERQRQAVFGALENGIFILTGGPGTGKTTVVRGMIEALEKQGFRLILGAPTGRAAKRLSEASGRSAATIHRLLEAQGGGAAPVFDRNAENPLDADVLILDEVSMMDITLLHYLLEALPEGCRVVFVGDADQLPAVGPGSVLKDMLRSGAIPSVRLNDVFRQAGESGIVMNAHAINQGRMPVCEVHGDFTFLELDERQAALAVTELCLNELPKQGFDALHDIQVLAPMHRLECGVANLNEQLQSVLNPPRENKPEIRQNGQIFRLGDKVMQIRNNYQKNVFNGDIGFINHFQGNRLIVQYSDCDVEYDTSELSELRLAYAMSVHKSQGSEYKVVILPLVSGHSIMLQRTLLYTAVTRAKEKVILLGSKKALTMAVMNDRTKKRYTLLAERLQQQMDGFV